MVAIPQQSQAEQRANATYEALMWALSRPGLTRDLPEPGVASIIDALIDRECAVYCADPEVAAIATRNGAALVDPDKADHLFLGALDKADILRRVSCGSDLYPETGATLVIEAAIGRGQALHLTGPGIDGVLEIAVDGLPTDFWSARQAVMRYPMGIELFLFDGARVLGLPRSTEIEVL